MSESQERMMAVVEPDDVAAFLAICAKWDVEAVVVGEVTDGDRLADRLARRARRRRAPALRRARRPDVPAPVRPPVLAGRPAGRRRRGAAPPGDRRRAARDAAAPGRAAPTCATSPGSPTSTTATCAATPCSPSRRDSGMIRVDEETNLGVAVSTDCNGRFAKLDPYAGAQLALAESYRNVATGGAVAARDLRLPQLRLARGPRRDVAVRRGLPRPQGRLPRARHPGHRRQRQPLQPDRRDRDPADARWSRCSASSRTSPVVRRPASRRRGRRPQVFLLGETREELSGSEWAHVVHGHLGGLPPVVDLPPRSALAELLLERRRAADQRPRPLRRRPGPGARRVLAAPRCAASPSRSEGDAVRRPVLRVGRPRAGHASPHDDVDRLRRPGRAPRRARGRLGTHRRRRAGRRGSVSTINRSSCARPGRDAPDRPGLTSGSHR